MACGRDRERLVTGTGPCGAAALREDAAELFLVLWEARQTLQWLFDESLARGKVSHVPALGAPAPKASRRGAPAAARFRE